MSFTNNIYAAHNNDTEFFMNNALAMNSSNSFAIQSSSSQQEPRYQKEHPPYCQCCANHGVQNRLKGHKNCDFQSCECLKCKIVKRRRRLMADQIKERRRQRKMEREAAKAAQSNAEALALQANQDTLSFAVEQPLNIADINTQLILDSLQFNDVMPCLPQAPMPIIDSAVPFAGINASNIGCSSIATSISPSNSIGTTSDELNISALALLESLRMTSFAPPAPTFSIPPPLNLCALQPGIPYSSMDVPVSPTMPLPMFPPNETFTYSNSEFSLPNTFLQQIQQSFFNDFLPLS